MIKGLSSTIYLKFMRLLFLSVSMKFRDELAHVIDLLHAKAKETKNPFDDFIVEVLRDVLL